MGLCFIWGNSGGGIKAAAPARISSISFSSHFLRVHDSFSEFRASINS